MNNELKTKLLAFIGAIDENITSSSIGWTKDGVNYGLNFNLYAGNLTINGSSYRPDPPPVIVDVAPEEK